MRQRLGSHGRVWRSRSVLGVLVVGVVAASSLSVGLVQAALGSQAAAHLTPSVRRPVAGLDQLALAARLRGDGTAFDSALWAPGAAVADAPGGGLDAGVGATWAVSRSRSGPAADAAIVPPPLNGFGSGAVAASAAPAPVELDPSRYSDVTPDGGTWALVIGVDDYPGGTYDLHSAVNDAQDVDEALRRMGVTNDRRMLLRDGQATAGVIRAGLDWLTAHAGPEATLVLFFAGHVQKLAPGTEAFVGADGGLVRDVEVARLLDRSPAARGWIGIAACYAAGFDELVRPGRILTAAASATALAYENSSFGRSYLVEYMVRRAMIGAGVTTVEAAFARAAEQLRREHPDRMPVQFDQVEGDLDLHRPPSAPDPAPGPAEPSPAPPSSPPPPSGGCAGLTMGVVTCTSDDGTP